MSERRHTTAAALAKETGLSARWFTAKAAKGKIPGAYQPAGERGAWRFDPELFWRWWDAQRAREGREWQPSIGAGRPGGDASSVRAVNSGSPLRQRLKEWRKSA